MHKLQSNWNFNFPNNGGPELEMSMIRKSVSITHFYKIAHISMWPFIHQKVLIHAENHQFVQLSVPYNVLFNYSVACDVISLYAPYYLAFNFTFN